MSPSLSSGSMIHTRTVKGQRAVLTSHPDLNPLHNTLLRMFNGFTPTEWLLGLLSSNQNVPDHVVCDLEREGLIARVE